MDAGDSGTSDLSALTSQVDALGNTMLRDFEHVDMSNVVLIFLTEGFFKSGPCAREVIRAILLGNRACDRTLAPPGMAHFLTVMVPSVERDGATVALI